MPFKFPVPVQIAYYRLERAITRPFRQTVFGRVWKRDVLVAKITGSYGKTTTSRMLAGILKTSGHTVGLSCSDGVLVDGRQMPGTGRSCYYGARRVFRHKNITAAVLECTVGGHIMQGQYAPRCNVAALLNVSDMHKGQYGLQSIEDTARVKQSIVQTSTGAIVINLDDPVSEALADTWAAGAVVGYSMNRDNPALGNLLGTGGRCITLSEDGDQIMLLSRGTAPEGLARVVSIPETAGGFAKHIAANAMAASGMALSLGVVPPLIREGLEKEAFAVHLKPRFRIVQSSDFQVVLDKALGPLALEKGVQAQSQIQVSGNRAAVLSAPEATMDDMLSDMAAIVSSKFDCFVCHGSNADRLARALESASIPGEAICCQPDLVSACKRARTVLEADGLIYVQVAYPNHHDLVLAALASPVD